MKPEKAIEILCDMYSMEIAEPDAMIAIQKAIKERDMAIDAICKLLWQRDYPNGGSIVRVYEENSYQDIELYRKETLALLQQKGGDQ